MKIAVLPILALASTVAGAPVSRSSLANAHASVDLLIRHLHSDREVAENAFRALQTKVLDYHQSVEGYQAWRAYAVEQERAVGAAEKVKQFLQKVEGLYGMKKDTGFQYQGLL